MKRTSACTLLLASASLLLSPGCASSGGTALGQQGTFSVEVQPYFGPGVKVYIEAYETDAAGKRTLRVATHRVTGDGVTGFVLPAGKTYGVRAYADLDGDKKCGPADPAGTLGGLTPETNLDVENVPPVLLIPAAGVAPTWPQKKPAAPAVPAGGITDDAARASQEPAPLPVPPPPPVQSLPVPPPP